MPVEKLKQDIHRFGNVFIQGYGQSEAPNTICYLPREDHVTEGPPEKVARLASVGRPYTLVRVRIVDNMGKDVPVGELGEIIVSGDHIMAGYWKEPEETAEALKDGWLHTRDIGRFDKDGYVYLVDRKSEMIISGGLNIYPTEVEQVLYSHPAVSEAAVIGVPDNDWGEIVKAIVVLKPGMKAREEELINLCRDSMASYKKPRSVEFRDSLPKSATGKILRKELREPYWKGRERKI
jgi:acyl-CoA synthetase (AMP-forming)/AMP-acid ligase II